jgi:cell division protein FtsB
MKDKDKIIQLAPFQKSNGVLPMQIITTEEMFQLEINELQKNLYAAYDRITELKEEIRKLESTKTNKE